MPFKNLEHNGGENFSSSTRNRHEVKEIKAKLEQKIEDEEEERLRKRQEAYMNPNNEALWDAF